MIASVQDILQYIPQRPPVVMIDNLLACTETSSTTSFTILSSNIFCENEYFTEAGILENIAQTGAAKLGYEYISRNKLVPPGFIGAIKNLEVNTFPKIGDTIETSISIDHEVMGVTVITGIVKLKGQQIAKAEMKIIKQPDLIA
jgi:3-hydroxymyristoyl/3-hydroxydecanoyl-(acyl carrier protein) dehydratase